MGTASASKTALAGRYKQHGNEDLIQFVGVDGSDICRIDSDGVAHIFGLRFIDGSYQGSAASTTQTTIDSGTF